MALHNFPEGMVTFIGSVNDFIFWFDNWFCNLSSQYPRRNGNFSSYISVFLEVRKAFLYAALSGITEPLGALFCYFVINSYLDDFVTAAIMSIMQWYYDFYFIFYTYSIKF